MQLPLDLSHDSVIETGYSSINHDDFVYGRMRGIVLGYISLHVLPAASIWFEVWGSWIRVQKISIFPDQFTKEFRFFQANFFKTISIFHEILIFFSNFQAKTGHLQLLLGKLFYFSSKVTTFEHTSCT